MPLGSVFYRDRGLSPRLAGEVAAELSAREDVLAVHARDERGMTALSHARPFQAAGASAASFTAGAAIPLIAVILSPSSLRIPVTMAAIAAALALDRIGGSPLGRRHRDAARFAWSFGGLPR